MTSLDELKRTLEERAQSAPDGATLLGAIVRTADRKRRQRTVTGAVLAIVVGLAMLVAVPAESHWLGRKAPAAPRPNPIGTPPPSPYRGPAQITVDLQANPKWAVRAYALDSTTQYLLVREPDVPEMANVGVIVHDPGTFTPNPLRNATSVRVQGHSAQQVARLTVATLRDSLGGYVHFDAPAIVWQDSAGGWVVVYALGTDEDVTALAELVRLGPPRAISVPSPISFTYVPPGLGLMFGTGPSPTAEVDLGFGDHSNPYPEVPSTGFGVYPLLVQVEERAPYLDGHDAMLGPPTMVNGVATWSSSHMEGMVVPPAGRMLVAEAGNCHVMISALDANRVSLAELQQMIAGSHFDDCHDTSSWGAFVPHS